MTLFEILGLIIFVAFQLLLIYLISFSRKKAESHFNKSLEKYKSDLIVEVGQKFIEQKGNIDEKIANLSGDIQKDVNRLQTDLQLIANQRNNFLNQKRDALVEFYSNYAYWMSTILNCYPNNMISKNALEMSRLYRQKMDEARMRYVISVAKLDLYVQDSELTKLKDDLSNNSYKLHDTMALCILKIRDIWLSLNRDYMTPNEADEAHKIFDELNAELDTTFRNELKSIDEKLRTKITKILSEILK